MLVGTRRYLFFFFLPFETSKMSFSLPLMSDIGTATNQWDEKNPTDEPDMCMGNLIHNNIINTKVGCRAQHTQHTQSSGGAASINEVDTVLPIVPAPF